MKRLRIWIAVSASCVAVTLTAPLCQPQANVKMTLTTNKQMYALGEIPEMSIAVENSTASSISIPLDGIFLESATVHKENQKVAAFTVPMIAEEISRNAVSFSSVAPGQVVNLPLQYFLETDFGEGAFARGIIGRPQYDQLMASSTPTGLLLQIPRGGADESLEKLDITPLIGTGTFTISVTYRYSGTDGAHADILRGPILSLPALIEIR